MLHIPLRGKSATDLSWAGLVITLGIVYGDLGTSPLYTMQAILRAAPQIDTNFVLGALSCVFWTLTLQTTVKYVLITLRASNEGEGGIFSLFTLVKGKRPWAYVVALIGACALLGDGVITPSITVTSAVEGLKLLTPSVPVVFWVLVILSGLFFAQQFGTSSIGKYFGPVMVVWFLMLAFFGLHKLILMPEVLKAVNPYYAYRIIVDHPHALFLLGAVFLCTTGAEALYSDLGHCGVRNIRISWMFVKTSLLLSYFGQGAYVLRHLSTYTVEQNPFFTIMPLWFLPIGVIISTLAAIIASQALISGAFTIVSEAISLNYFPKVHIRYPTTTKGQMYIPMVNTILYVCCVLVVLYFRTSDAMEAAYGLSITIAMLMTSFLLMFYLKDRIPLYGVVAAGAVFFTVESTFLLANLTKFFDGGWVSVMLGLVFFSIMFVWVHGSKIYNGYIKYTGLKPFLPIFQALSADKEVPKYATQVAYTSHSNQKEEIEHYILYSVLCNPPKRADVYWFIYADYTDAPFQMTYEVDELVIGKVFRIDFHLGYKTEPRLNLYFRQALMHLHSEGRMDLTSRYPSLHEAGVQADFRFVTVDMVQNHDFNFPVYKQLLMNYFFIIRRLFTNDAKYWGLDHSLVSHEEAPMDTSLHFIEDRKKE